MSANGKDWDVCDIPIEILEKVLEKMQGTGSSVRFGISRGSTGQQPNYQIYNPKDSQERAYRGNGHKYYDQKDETFTFDDNELSKPYSYEYICNLVAAKKVA